MSKDDINNRKNETNFLFSFQKKRETLKKANFLDFEMSGLCFYFYYLKEKYTYIIKTNFYLLKGRKQRANIFIFQFNRYNIISICFLLFVMYNFKKTPIYLSFKNKANQRLRYVL